MFEAWPDERTLRVFDPPRLVVLDMVRFDPTSGRPYSAAPEGVSLRVRASGARIESVMPGATVGLAPVVQRIVAGDLRNGASQRQPHLVDDDHALGAAGGDSGPGG